jgi:lysophospholipase L1-like esterase
MSSDGSSLGDPDHRQTASMTPTESRCLPLPGRAIRQLDSFTSATTFGRRIRSQPKRFIGIAEGDSWFDFLPAYFDLDFCNGDLLGELNQHPDLHVFKLARAGETLEDIAYGPNGSGRNLQSVTAAMRRFDARFLLLSVGGNDIAGPELESLLHPIQEAPDPSMPVIDAMEDRVFGDSFARRLHHILDTVKRESPDAAIFLHGYDYAVPDGRGVLQLPFGFSFAGPWLKPAFDKKGIQDHETRQRVIRRLIDRLNATLSHLARERVGEHVHYVDLRGTLATARPGHRRDWADELHPTGRGWAKIAEILSQTIVSTIGERSIGGHA